MDKFNRLNNGITFDFVLNIYIHYTLYIIHNVQLSQ